MEPVERTERVLLDRADRLLQRQGITLEWRATPAGHRIEWKDAARGPISAPLDPPAPRRAAALPAGLLRSRVLAVAGHDDLVEVACVRGFSHRLRLVDRDAKTVCRVSVDRGSTVAPHRDRPLRLRNRVRVVPVKGYEAIAARIAARLSEQPGWQVNHEPVFDEALRRIGRLANATARSRIAAHLRSMEKHRKAIDPAADPEELHDFRVSLRRVRTLFAQAEPSAASSLAGEFKWLGQVSGAARDLDVQAEALRHTLRERCPGHRSTHPRIEERVEGRRREVHRKLAEALSSKRYARLLRAVRRALRTPGPRREMPDRPGAPAPPPLCIAKLYRKALRQGRGLDRLAPDEHFHRLRKTVKKLRYLLESRPAQGEAARRENALKSLKGMQTILGELNDVSVQKGLLDTLRTELCAGCEVPDELRCCLDAVLDFGEERRRALKTAFVRHFEDLCAKRMRRDLLGPDAGKGSAR